MGVFHFGVSSLIMIMLFFLCAAIAANQPLCGHPSTQLALSTALSDGDGWFTVRHAFVFGGAHLADLP